MSIDAALGRLGIQTGVCTSSTRPANPYEGQVIYETDTNRSLVYDNAAWVVIANASPTGFPTSLDTNTVDSIAALQAKVGADSSAVTSSHDYKIADHATSIADHASRLTTLEAISHGKILQVVYGTQPTKTGTNSTTFATINLSATITPSSTSSKILALVTVPVHVFISGGGVAYADIRLYRGATAIGDIYTIEGGYQSETNFSRWAKNQTGVISLVDSPSTTSATTYTVYGAATNTSSIVYFCSFSAAGFAPYLDRTGTITLLEVGP